MLPDVAMTATESDLGWVYAFLVNEAALLDERRYSEWEALFADEATYWLPQSRTGGDPEQEVSIIYDDRTRISDRVSRLQSGDAFAQVPESETLHLVGSVLAHREGEAVIATATEFVVDHHGERETLYAGNYEFKLVETDGAWKIRSKVVRLVNAASPLGNLSIIL